MGLTVKALQGDGFEVSKLDKHRPLKHPPKSPRYPKAPTPNALDPLKSPPNKLSDPKQSDFKRGLRALEGGGCLGSG